VTPAGRKLGRAASSAGYVRARKAPDFRGFFFVQVKFASRRSGLSREKQAFVTPPHLYSDVASYRGFHAMSEFRELLKRYMQGEFTMSEWRDIVRSIIDWRDLAVR
jgi:hypothetical protein